MSIQKSERPAPQSYGDDTIEIAVEKAKALGCTVVFPKPNELFLDIDTEASMRRFVRGVSRLRRVSYVVRSSPSGLPGRYHIVVTMPRPVSPLERIALQAMLGSDLTRELLSWMRIQRGIDEPTLFFERQADTTQ